MVQNRIIKMDPSNTYYRLESTVTERKVFFVKICVLESASCFIPRIKVRHITVVKINVLGYFVP